MMICSYSTFHVRIEEKNMRSAYRYLAAVFDFNFDFLTRIESRALLCRIGTGT